jgi:glycosyltransferase involved in cell wall biosynthesis
MNIWIFNHYADPPDGQSTRSYDLSKQLVDQGHQVTIFAAGFSHYSFKEERIRSGEAWREENWNGARFLWIKTMPYRENDWRRVCNMISYSWRAFWVGSRRKEKPDAISGVSVHPFAALSAWVLSVVKGSRFYIELTDLWPEVLIDFGMLSPRSPVTWCLRVLEKFLYRRAQRIIMIWPRTEEYVRRLGVSPAKVVWIPHVAELSRYETLRPYDGVIRNKFTVMYVGSFVSFMAVDEILKAAKVLQERGRGEVCFVLVGGGTDMEKLKRLAEDLKLYNVKFPGLVPKKDVARIMSEADAFVVSLRKVPLLKYGISLNKICDYLASGRPTILAGEPGYDPIREARAGVSVPAENPVALADAIEALMARTPEERVQMGQNGREYVGQMHALPILAERYERTLRSTLREDAGRGKAAEVSA